MFSIKNALYLFFILAGMFSANLSWANSCSIPFNLKTWDYYAKQSIRSGKDWKSNETTDYWKLVYSWSPTFCSSKGNRAKALEQCRQDFGLIVHGLWAQKAGTTNIRRHPRNCVDAPAVSKKILKENFCLMPDVKLMQKEWEKHGTCDFKKPEEYFAAIQMLNQKIRMPEKRVVQGLQSKSARALSQWLVDNNKQQGLRFEHVDVRKSSNRLKEISICFDKEFELRSCKSNKKSSNYKETYKSNNQNSYKEKNRYKEIVKKTPDTNKNYQKYDSSNNEKYSYAHEKHEKNLKKHNYEKSHQHIDPTEETERPWWKKLLQLIVIILEELINS